MVTALGKKFIPVVMRDLISNGGTASGAVVRLNADAVKNVNISIFKHCNHYLTIKNQSENAHYGTTMSSHSNTPALFLTSQPPRSADATRLN